MQVTGTKEEPVSTFSEVVARLSERENNTRPTLTLMEVPPSPVRCCFFHIPDAACGDNIIPTLIDVMALIEMYVKEVNASPETFYAVYAFLPRQAVLTEAQQDTVVAALQVLQAGGRSGTVFIESSDTTTFTNFLSVMEESFTELVVTFESARKSNNTVH